MIRFFEFQFYDSPIKRFAKASTFTVHTGFNSMIVRLKGDMGITDIVSLSEFQFYDSPIKSCIAARAVMADTTVSIL